MKAIVTREPGGPEAMQWIDIPDIVPGPGEVLLKIAAAGINRADILQRKGFYPPPPGASPYLGLEASGTIEALGDGVETWKVGDEVCALLTGGGYATHAAVPAVQLLPRPAGVSLVDSAALPEVVATVWSNVFMLAGLRPDETLLIHGGTSGIGTMAIQLAKNLGAQVVVTCGTDDKVAAALALGADVGINYRDQDFVAATRAATDERGADVVLDVMGAKYLERNVDVLAVNGRLVVIGLQGGVKAELNLLTLLNKRAAVLATSLRHRPVEEKGAIVASVLEHVWPLIADGTIRPVIDRVLPISEVAAAHEVIEASGHIGKVLLTP